MNYRSCARIALCLGLVPALAVAQRARVAREDPFHDDRPFLAPRFLFELESSTRNHGARATGDLDGDGDLDLVTLEYSPTSRPPGARAWLNEGEGDFSAGPLLVIEPWDGDGRINSRIATVVFLADVTGDGVLDLAYERGNPSTPVAGQGVLVHPGLGDGSFGAGLLAPNGVQGDFHIGDCDGDGDADLLMVDSSGMAWRSFQAGSFVAGTSIAITTGQLSTVDLDGDGLTDIVSRWTTVRLYRTVAGVPTFLAEIPLPPEIPTGNSRVRAGDLDGDGDTDLLALHQSSVFRLLPLRNDGTSFTALPLQAFEPVPYQNIDIHGVLADWDGDGDADYVSSSLVWMENVGAASFALPASESEVATVSLESPVQVVDVNGDGRLDALRGKVCLFGNGSIPDRSSLTAGIGAFGSPAWDLLEDWEGDGDLDLVSSRHLYLNNGDGTFESRSTPRPAPPGTGSGIDIAWGDFDGDGFRDLVVIDLLFHFKGMRLFRGTEDGSYVSSSTVPSPIQMTGGLAGDLDGDGDLDILAEGGIWQNDGTGQFGTAVVPVYSGVPRVAQDVDGDLDLDLLVERPNRLWMLTNLGGLSFSEVNLGPYASTFHPVFMDVDEDGDLDLAVTQDTNDVVRVREQLPGGSFAAPFDLPAAGVFSRAGQIDVDADGRLDLVASASTPEGIGHLVVWFRGAGLDFPRRRDWVTDDYPSAFGDVDGDGDVEPIGGSSFENFRFDGPEDGSAVQYGLELRTPGTDGRHPILGSRLPVRPGRDAELVIRGGLGGASGFLLRGPARASVFAGGFHNLVQAPEIVHSFVLDGAPDVAGAGSHVVRRPITAAIVGRTFAYQAVIVDPGASAGLAATNGLEIRYGDWPAAR